MIPCCYDYNNQIILGNAFETPVMEILSGEKYEDLRDAHRKGEFFRYSYCDQCDQLLEHEDALIYTNRHNLPNSEAVKLSNTDLYNLADDKPIDDVDLTDELTMITVWCVYWGNKYHPAYVYELRDAVKKNLTVEHEFKCITVDKFPGIITRNPPVSYSGWWQKLGLFAPQVATGPSLYFDLDVVITGNLDYLVPFTECEFAAPENWARSGHGGIQSSVMAWKGNYHLPYASFDYPVDSERLWGDQEFLWELLGR